MARAYFLLCRVHLQHFFRFLFRKWATKKNIFSSRSLLPIGKESIKEKALLGRFCCGIVCDHMAFQKQIIFQRFQRLLTFLWIVDNDSQRAMKRQKCLCENPKTSIKSRFPCPKSASGFFLFFSESLTAQFFPIFPSTFLLGRGEEKKASTLLLVCKEPVLTSVSR